MMEILGIGIIDVNTDAKPWLAFQKRTMRTRAIDSQGDVAGAQLTRYQENPIFGDSFVYRKDHFGLGFILLKFTAPDGICNNDLESTFHDKVGEIIASGALLDTKLVCLWSHLILDAKKANDGSVYVGSKDIEFGSTTIRPGYCFTKTKNWDFFHLDDSRLVDGILCAEREWFFINKDNQRLTDLLSKRNIEQIGGSSAVLDDMGDQLIRNILHDEQVLYMPALSIQVYQELRAVWSIPDLSTRLEARSQEVYEILRQKSLQVEGDRSESRNRILLLISLLTVFQVMWTGWSFTFDRVRHDQIFRGPGLFVSISSLVICVIILGHFTWRTLRNRKVKV